MADVKLEHLSKIYEPEKKGTPKKKTIDDISFLCMTKNLWSLLVHPVVANQPCCA
jgi:hypothetical protein